MVDTSILDRFRLDDKVVLITGGAQGIGKSFAFTLGAVGAKIIIADLQVEKGEATIAELSAKGIEAVFIPVDVSSRSSIKEMVNKAISKWGNLTIAINNAGLGGWADAEEMDESHWDQIMTVNLRGVMFCSQSEAKAMIPQGYGKIINMGSVSAHVVLRPQNQSAYNASKAGVFHLTRTLAGEWAKYGIRVNSLSPGYTRTEMLEDLLQTEDGQALVSFWTEQIPLGELAVLEDLQGAILFLASEASDYMTGADIVVDGGYSVW